MSTERRYSREILAEAVAASHSWRGVMRQLGRPEHSAGALRVVRREVAAFGISHSHFTGQQRWSDRQLIDAVSAAHTWREVQTMLGLAGSGGDLRDVRMHATRLDLDTSHLTRRVPQTSTTLAAPQIGLLRTAGPTLAAGWFMLRGYQVVWPLEPCRFDFAASTSGGFEKIQVKTATYQNSGSYIASLSNSRRPGRREIYDVGEIDSFFVIDGDLNAFWIPFEAVAGFGQISLRSYRNCLVAERGQWLTEVPAVAS